MLRKNRNFGHVLRLRYVDLIIIIFVDESQKKFWAVKKQSPFYAPKKLVLIYGSLKEVGGNLLI